MAILQNNKHKEYTRFARECLEWWPYWPAEFELKSPV